MKKVWEYLSLYIYVCDIIYQYTSMYVILSISIHPCMWYCLSVYIHVCYTIYQYTSMYVILSISAHACMWYYLSIYIYVCDIIYQYTSMYVIPSISIVTFSVLVDNVVLLYCLQFLLTASHVSSCNNFHVQWLIKNILSYLITATSCFEFVVRVSDSSLLNVLPAPTEVILAEDPNITRREHFTNAAALLLVCTCNFVACLLYC